MEQPIQSVDFSRLCRQVLAHTDEEKAALQYVLSEFFVLTGDVYTHNYCDEIIEKYKANVSAKAKAGAASAEAKRNNAKQRIEERISKNEQDSITSSTESNTCSTAVTNKKPETRNQKPETNNQEPNKKHTASDDAIRVADYLAQRILIKSPDAKIKPDSWLKDIDLAIRLDNRTANDLIAIIDWIYSPAGAFWIPNIMSGQKLRQKYDTMKLQAGAGTTKKPAPDNFQSKNYGENRDI